MMEHESITQQVVMDIYEGKMICIKIKSKYTEHC